jgi:probable F420-dependent oxidoreductase
MPENDSTAHSFGVAIPQIGPSATEAGSLARFVTRADELGFDTLWTSELTTARIIDPLMLLASAAAQTRRSRLGVAVILVPLRIPVQLARDLASLDILSGGRLTVGVGYGSKPEVYPRYGLPAEGRLRRYVDALELLRLLWTEEEVSFDGEWQLHGPTEVPRPVQSPHPPLWFGARAEPALRRATERGDGWIGSGVASLDEFSQSLGYIRRQLDSRGRNPHEFVIAKRVYAAVTDGDPSAYRQRMREWFGANYGKPELGDAMGYVGDAEQIAESLRRVLDLGARHLILNPVFDELEQMEVLANEVIPKL